ncbi:Glycine--tRNA ligase, partial [Dictyocoela roeselum]
MDSKKQNSTDRSSDTKALDSVLRKRLFILPSFYPYGGVSGLYDYGPIGLSLKTNILEIFRRIFVGSNDNIYEVETSLLTPYAVLKASGHVDKFCDLLVFDRVTGDCYRADHYLKEALTKIKARGNDEYLEHLNLNDLETLTPAEIDDLIARYEIKSPLGNELGDARTFNLMFSTEVGAKGKV